MFHPIIFSIGSVGPKYWYHSRFPESQSVCAISTCCGQPQLPTRWLVSLPYLDIVPSTTKDNSSNVCACSQGNRYSLELRILFHACRSLWLRLPSSCYANTSVAIEDAVRYATKKFHRLSSSLNTHLEVRHESDGETPTASTSRAIITFCLLGNPSYQLLCP